MDDATSEDDQAIADGVAALAAKLKTTAECAQMEINALGKGRGDIAIASRKRAIELRAIEFGSDDEVERECLEAVFAYEECLRVKNGRRTNASRTWPAIRRDGVIKAVDDIVQRKTESAGYALLAQMGLGDYAFEAVVLRHPERFTAEAVAQSIERMEPGR